MVADHRYRGLLIGNAVFPKDPHGLLALNGPLVDIKQLQQALIDEEVGLFAPDNLPKLPDKGVQELRKLLDGFFTDAARDDVLLLYYSGHGMLDERGALYLCANDTETRSLRSTALSAAEINNMIEGSAAATTIIVLDCCHSGVLKGADLAAPVAGRGRYVLTSSRATQLALAATDPGQPSPFTGLLVRGLRHADAKNHLTIVELYRQVYRWMTKDTALAPQLRIAGEGEVIIARRGNQPLPEPAPDEPPIESSPAAESPRTWHAQRVRTAGVNTVLLVSNGSEKHTVEYRSRSDHRAVVLRDGQRVYHGPYLLDCKFDLGRNGTLARLKVTDDPDIQLWIDQTQVYTLRQAEPGSADFLEHRAAAIRAALLAAKTNGLEKSGERARLRVAPDIGFLDSRAVWARTGRSASVVSAGPVIGVVTIEGRDRAWFTDRALHIRSASGLFVVPYDELAATRVAVEDFSTLKLYSTREDGHREIPMRHPDRIVPVINAVKKAVRRQGKGLGDPPPIRFSGTRASHDIFVALACVGSWMAGITALLAIFVLAQGIRMDLDVDAWYRHTYPLVIGFALGGCMATPLLGGIAAVCRVKPSFGLSMFLVAVYTLIVSAFITWRPEAIQARETDVMPQVDWAIRLPGLPVIALGNSADIVALGPWPRVLGTLFVTAVAFLAVTIVPMVRRRRMCRPRLW